MITSYKNYRSFLDIKRYNHSFVCKFIFSTLLLALTDNFFKLIAAYITKLIILIRLASKYASHFTINKKKHVSSCYLNTAVSVINKIQHFYPFFVVVKTKIFLYSNPGYKKFYVFQILVLPITENLKLCYAFYKYCIKYVTA